MKVMEDYHELYLIFDVLLLADVFEKIKNRSVKNYWLSSSHFLSAPALRWDRMLGVTKAELDLILDFDIYLFLSKETRAGVSYVFNRYSKVTGCTSIKIAYNA